jgi:hypothetical protein
MSCSLVSQPHIVRNNRCTVTRSVDRGLVGTPCWRYRQNSLIMIVFRLRCISNCAGHEMRSGSTGRTPRTARHLKILGVSMLRARLTSFAVASVLLTAVSPVVPTSAAPTTHTASAHTPSSVPGCFAKGKRLFGKVFVEKSQYSATFKVFQSASAYSSNTLKVWSAPSAYQATACGRWYFVKSRYQADFSVYFVSSRSAANFSVYFVNSRYQAG